MFNRNWIKNKRTKKISAFFGLVLISTLFILAPVQYVLADNWACVCDFEVEKLDGTPVASFCHYQDNGMSLKVWKDSISSHDDPQRECRGVCQANVNSILNKSEHRYSSLTPWVLEDISRPFYKDKIRRCDEQKYVSVVAEEAEKEIKLITPTLNVPIPGLTFTKPLLKGDYLTTDFLGEYISAVYKWLIGGSITVAIVMVMIGGLQYVLSAGRGDISQAKERITNAVVGFVLLVGTFVILYTVNPQLTLLNNLRIQTIKPIPEIEDDEVDGQVATSFSTPREINVFGSGKEKVPTDLVDKIDAAAKKLNDNNYGIWIASSYRSVEKQEELINQNCKNPPGSKKCDPKDGKPQTCILVNNDPAKCPHTTGRALDMWAMEKNTKGQWQRCVNQKQCIGDKQSCFNNPCQAALISAMKAEGFCVLNSEPWHFEQPKMSRGCN